MEPYVELSGKALAALAGRLTRGVTAELLRKLAGLNLCEGDSVSVTHTLRVTGVSPDGKQLELTDPYGERHTIDL